MFLVKWQDLSEKVVYRGFPEIYEFHVSARVCTGGGGTGGDGGGLGGDGGAGAGGDTTPTPSSALGRRGGQPRCCGQGLKNPDHPPPTVKGALCIS